MNNTEVLNEYFIWEEKNLIEQKNNCLNNNESVHYDTITETKNDSIKNDWRDITDPKLRKKMREKNYREANKDKLKLKRKLYLENNGDRTKEKMKIWRTINKEKIIKYNKIYNTIHKDRIKEYKVNRIKTNTHFKLASRLRTRLCNSLKNNIKSGSAVDDLGCSLQELKIYLESKFQPGMNWDNWNKDGWHIDHIKPLASFDLSDHKQMLEACHYTNLQPLWAKDNLTKSDKIDHPSIYQ
jgi:hypothetical protein